MWTQWGLGGEGAIMVGQQVDMALVMAFLWPIHSLPKEEEMEGKNR